MIVTTECKNLEQWSREMDSFINDLEYSAIQRAAKNIYTHFKKAEDVLFQSEGGAGKHGRWPPLTKKYKKWKEIHFPGRGIMVRSEALRKSLTGGSGKIFFSSKTSGGWQITMGSDVKSKGGFDYPSHHQTEAAKKRRTIDPPDSLLDGFARLIEREIIRKAKVYRTAFDIAKERQATWG